MFLEDLGTLPYRDGWAHQERVHAQVLAGGDERLLLVEHPPVITCGRRPNVAKNLLASAQQIEQLGVEFVESDRGGDVTFHGPGQLVAYPIVRLIDHGLSVGGYVRRLEQAVIAALGDLGIEAKKDECAVGVWVDEGPIRPNSPQAVRPGSPQAVRPGSPQVVRPGSPQAVRPGSPQVVRPGSPQAGTLAKICALGVRVRRGVTMHGIALNVTTDLSYFNLIIPCGLSGRPVTSIQRLRGNASPTMDTVKRTLARRLIDAFSPVDAAAAGT